MSTTTARVQVIQHLALSLQVCAVADATEEEIVREANRQMPCGTPLGWLFTDGSRDAGRVACAHDPHRVHVVLGC